MKIFRGCLSVSSLGCSSTFKEYILIYSNFLQSHFGDFYYITQLYSLCSFMEIFENSCVLVLFLQWPPLSSKICFAIRTSCWRLIVSAIRENKICMPHHIFCWEESSVISLSIMRFIWNKGFRRVFWRETLKALIFLDLFLSPLKSIPQMFMYIFICDLFLFRKIL